MLPKLWECPEAICPFYLWSDGNKKCSAHASFFSHGVPHASTRLAVAPYMPGFEA